MTEYSKLIELDDTIMSTLPDLDKIDARQPSELEHNRALEQGIVFQERIDRLLNSAHKRRNDALHLLDLCRHGLGQHGREISNQIIIAEVSEITPLPATTDAVDRDIPMSAQDGEVSAQNVPMSARDAEPSARDTQTPPPDLENQDSSANATPSMGETPVENAAALPESAATGQSA